MCGIVAYIGKKQAYPIILKGLKRLEYRGYDSAGIALLDAENSINLYKRQGKVSNLEEFAADKDLFGHLGIGHTRWATHGAPNDVNAHPHMSMDGSIALIHNGIIENYDSLKKELIKQGYIFQSETDTEVLVHLTDHIGKKENVWFGEALRLALSHVVGARHAASRLTCHLHGTQQQADEAADDRNHHQEFDEGERSGRRGRQRTGEARQQLESRCRHGLLMR